MAVAAKAKSQPIQGTIVGDQVVRFDAHQRAQHIIMLSSFLVLALTGLPLKYADLGVSQWWIGFWGGIENTRLFHRLFAAVMAADCVYHAVYVVYSTRVLKRPFPYWMIPSVKDVRDMLGDMLYFFRIREARPKFDRFNYKEKFDYWAIFWGMPVMGGTGLVLTFPVVAARLLPGWIVPLSLEVHSDEALLAVGWILLVHWFFALRSLLSRPVFPLNSAMFSGTVPLERYRHEHPLEYERIVEQEKGEQP